MDHCKLERALGIIEGVSWAVEAQALADALQTAVGMIEEAVEEAANGAAT